MNDAGVLSRPPRPKVNPHFVWSIVNLIRAVLLASGAFALGCSIYSMFVRTTDDNVIVGAIFFGIFTVSIAGVAIIAALHRVFLAVHVLGEDLTEIAEPSPTATGDPSHYGAAGGAIAG
ncbi:MAG: hypothetical protein M3Z31_08675 [Pseudomonadota bacterium]|nr:hypothetical protein [Pseudomonadota bacterium]